MQLNVNTLHLALVFFRTDLLLSGWIVLWCGFVERPLIVGVVVHPLTEMVAKVKTPTKRNTLCYLPSRTGGTII